MKKFSGTDEAYAWATSRCAQREHCRSELLPRFIEGGLRRDEAFALLDRLEEERYIDEARYAKAFVHDKTLYDRWGRMKTLQALRLRGIGASHIDEAMAQISEEAYRDMLRELLEAKRRTIKASSARERTEKLVRFAAARGFEAHEVFALLGERGLEEWEDE